ncbi:flavin-containing monooxygenase [Microbacterium sp.]|uniref:flavin-containing monooxygenase n=1 Tax=Microbacterium sp. TaxID=51671 RepID=UPI0039E55B2F
MSTTSLPVAVIGAGAAGLTTAKLLADRGVRFEVFDEHPRIGDSWRERYRSLHLFTPRRFAALPGLRPRIGVFDYPTAAQMASYLEEYATRFRLPVRLSAPVRRLARDADGTFRLSLAEGEEVHADRVVVTAGAHRRPVMPVFAPLLDASIVQLHSIGYRGPEQLASGTVLVVGAGNSGTDIALEAAASGHPVVVAGRIPGEIPFGIDSPIANLISGAVIRRLTRLTIDTEKGRAAKAAQEGHGIMLIRNKERDLLRAGVRRVGRIEEIRDGRPVADGEEIAATTVVWCTGSRPELGWIDIRGALDASGNPIEHRGIATGCPGLGFVGLDFQYSAASSTLPGFAADARYVLDSLLGPDSAALARAA